MRKIKILGMLFLSVALIFVGYAEAATTNDRYDFHYYQLRDVSGLRSGHTVAGAQWFATVSDWYFSPVDNRLGIFQDTEGAQTSVPMVTSADLIYNFQGVYMEDPQHYKGGNPYYKEYPDEWRYRTEDPWDWYYHREDLNFDRMDSVYLVIPDGKGELNINFYNDLASHNPPPENMFGEPYAVTEDILVGGLNDYYSVSHLTKPQLVTSSDYLPAKMNFNAANPQSYGSSQGWLTFRQSASFDVNFNGYRESINIPLVVANVHDGPASDPGNELYFDMSLFDGDNKMVARKKFRWGVDKNKIQGLGTFFMISGDKTEYRLDTQITNRTGVRYRQQRYDVGAGGGVETIYPSNWSYDIPDDLYNTLPKVISLDLQSQIAPGLITHYTANVDMSVRKHESFRLYPFDQWSGYSGYDDLTTPRDLELTFSKVRGMASYGTRYADGVSVTGFSMTFVDNKLNTNDVKYNTLKEIERYTGTEPEMPSADYTLPRIYEGYFGRDPLNAFTISADVPDYLKRVSEDITLSAVSQDKKTPLLPVRVRMTFSRQVFDLIDKEKWNELLNAESVIDKFAETYTIWVYSPNTDEKVLNLFDAIRRDDNTNGVFYSVSDCVGAFIEGNSLHVEFVALIADSVSLRDGKSAFCYVVEDDGIPYILFGDGKIDDGWNLSFYIDKNVSGPDVINPGNKTPGDGEGGGGGCNQGSVSAAIFALLAVGWFIKRAKRIS
ncbi:hypothetical protein FACS1894204_07190 [Synergistales bacterium]|nr:hypothetical protein FACS1894204_07190 [Synergistales bacterium]